MRHKLICRWKGKRLLKRRTQQVYTCPHGHFWMWWGDGVTMSDCSFSKGTRLSLPMMIR